MLFKLPIVIIKAPIQHKLKWKFILDKNGISFNVGHGASTASECFKGCFKNGWDAKKESISVKEAKSLVNNNNLIYPDISDDQRIIYKCIGSFDYLETSDERYSFSLERDPILGMGIAMIEMLQVVPQTESAVKTKETIIKAVYNHVENKIPSDISRRSEWFDMLVRITSLTSAALDGHANKIDNNLSSDFDFRSLIT